ncbi:MULTISPECIES: GNAT family acetyltransferase [unclassified Brenneria]|uniref:GNAT family acetyltransferase n=1 Tax=unclassified Brenneria TaxID=2634434 RepID=UPI0029C23AB3|nr:MULTISPECIES: GNAT family acetyltransferase [unclassified Brenneria]MDX5626651.1 GNAT family acetyltransferase [Brenneria sp. L3-3Z]MDX5693999.1 GNAT family acetyltransferase [Brenneria sp. L4-2C]MEE3661360.1 GNAT family acetyltransferase [Brenneria sp. g21c3]
MELAVANITDIDAIMTLHKKYHVHSIKEDDKTDGFVTTLLTKEQIISLIEDEQGAFVAKEDGKVVAFVFAASWAYWSAWPFFQYMIGRLGEVTYNDEILSTENSYQYGPICIDKAYRGSGLLNIIFDFALKEMSKKFPYLVTFVNQTNGRSYTAHAQKLALDVLLEFEFNQNQYYFMVCKTNK